jgi:ABC-type transport system involved in multi-copper enzyme maturation permease subunit
MGAIGIAFLWTALARQLTGKESGGEIFALLDRTILLMLMTIGPLMTADSISKERREGTLDLLFLTPLTAARIISAKFIARLLQLMGLWLVMVPLMTVPVLAGGITGTLLAGSLLKHLSVILISLGAGMLATVLARRAIPAMILSLVLAAPLLWLVTKVNTTATAAGGFQAVTFASGGIFVVQQPQQSFWTLNSFFLHHGSRWGLVALLSSLLTLLILRIAVQQLISAREERAESETHKWFREVFFTPLYWKSGFRRWLSRKMDKNPLIWLEYRRTGSRVGRWVLVLLLVMIETYSVTERSLSYGFLELQLQMGFVLMLILAITAASSFQREKENGAFELLLVAPFTEGSLLNGRLRAVWSYYLPALLTLAAPVWLAFTWNEARSFPLSGQEAIEFARAVSLGLSVLTIPLAGLWLALRSRRFIMNLIGTVLFGLVLPYYFLEYFTGMVAAFFTRYFSISWLEVLVFFLNPENFPYVFATVLLQGVLAAVFYRKAFECLRARQFA